MEEEPTPAAPIVEEPAPEPVVETVILDEPAPAAPLPQTGGLSSMLLYGIGSLLAGTGFAFKRKEKK